MDSRMSDLPQTTVLVVDDEPLVRMDLAEQLQAAGYRTVEACHADEAIAILEKHLEIRVVFTDVQMPGSMDGLALSHYIRKRWPPTILIISSGNKAPNAADMPSDVDFLSKPFWKDALDKVLHNVARKLATA